MERLHDIDIPCHLSLKQSMIKVVRTPCGNEYYVISPLVRLFFACAAVEEAQPAGVIIRDPISTIDLPTFPYECKDIGVYAQLADGLGEFLFSIECRRNGMALQRTRPKKVVFPPQDRLSVFEVPIVIDSLRFPENDVYELHLLCNHKSIASTTLLVYGSDY